MARQHLKKCRDLLFVFDGNVAPPNPAMTPLMPVS
tara:strand:+ start:325 stop:429 length:105 start_codon:yes stop_codon:yes gene_type:complete